MPNVGDRVVLAIDKPAAGGRMLGRLDGQIALVANAIPGERVRARIDGRRGGVLFATAVEVIEASPDRQEAGSDPACGGRSFAHIRADRQRAIKVEIVRDAFSRLGRIELPATVAVHASPDEGYRMRARLHVSQAEIGFYREGTHTLCDPACSRQLLPATIDVLSALSDGLRRSNLLSGRSLELAENRDASERALYLEIEGHARRGLLDELLGLPGVTGLGIAREGRPIAASGSPVVSDSLTVRAANQQATLRLRRHVTGFFQGNRYLLPTLVERVLAQLPPGPVCDLYAGVGLFGLAHAALGRGEVIAVESDRQSVEDLVENAAPFAQQVTVEPTAVEVALAGGRLINGRTAIVDPPRTGLSRQVVAALAEARPAQLIYVSCDPATLARDAGRLVAAGYEVTMAEVFDLFPGTAHVETMVAMGRRN